MIPFANRYDADDEPPRIELDEDEWAVLFNNPPVVTAAVHWDTAMAILADLGINGVEFLGGYDGLGVAGVA